MAYCRTALLVRLTLGLALGLAQCQSVSPADDPASQDLRHRTSTLRAAATTHGMRATSATTARISVASTLGSAAASVAVASRRAGGWLHGSSGGSTRRAAAVRGDNWSSSSTRSVGEGRRALSLLAPAVAPRAGTSALFVVSPAGPAGAPPRARETYLSEADRARCRCVCVRVCVVNRKRAGGREQMVGFENGH